MNELSFAVAMSVALYLDKNSESLLNCFSNTIPKNNNYFTELSNLHPKPKDVCKFLQNYLYPLQYGPSISKTWKYPESK